MKRSTPDKPAADIPYAGCLFGRNQWIRIGLSPAEAKLVTRAAKGYKFKDRPAARMGRCLVMMALLNLPAIEESLRQVNKYCEAEGLDMEDYCERRAKRVLEELGA